MRLQNLGSVGYTDFEVDGEDMIDMYTEKPELMDQRTGLVHSHHGMDTFFSGTDTDELHEKAMNGLYLSLILNNDWEPIAKLAWGGQVERKIESKWDWSTIGIKTKNSETEKMDVVYELDLNVEMEGEAQATFERFKDLKKKQEAKSKSIDRTYLSAGRAFNGELGIPGKQSDLFGLGLTKKMSETERRAKDIIDTVEQMEDEGSPLDQLNQAGYWESVGGQIIMADINYEGVTIGQAITDFAQVVVRGNEDPDFVDNVKEAMFNNIKKGKPILLEIMGEMFISKADYQEICEELLDELDSIQGRIADAMRAGIEEYIAFQDRITL